MNSRSDYILQTLIAIKTADHQYLLNTPISVEYLKREGYVTVANIIQADFTCHHVNLTLKGLWYVHIAMREFFRGS